MGYAPQSIIQDGPHPALSGTVITLPLDNFDRFPEEPFRYLAWPTQTVPNLGNDSEEGVCLSNDHGTITLQRPARPVAVLAGMQFAAVGTVDIYNIEETVTLSEEFPSSDTGVALQLRTPSGAVGRYESALAEAVGANGGSAYSLAFSANESGLWHYEFVSSQRVFPEDDFFVRFSEVR